MRLANSILSEMRYRWALRKHLAGYALTMKSHQSVTDLRSTHPTSAVLSDAWHFAKLVTLSLALRSSGDAGRGFGRVGAAAALVA